MTFPHPLVFTAPAIASFVLGLAGAFLCVGAYIAINFPGRLGRYGMTQNDITYHVMNTVGGFLAAIAALLEVLFHGAFGAIPLVLLEGIWGIVGMIALVEAIRGRQKGDAYDVDMDDSSIGDLDKAGGVRGSQSTWRGLIPAESVSPRETLGPNNFPDGKPRAWSSGDVRRIP